jgi:hypothetical protein
MPIYLFIYLTFKDVDDSSVRYDRITGRLVKYCTGKDVEVNDCGLLRNSMLAVAWRG